MEARRASYNAIGLSKVWSVLFALMLLGLAVRVYIAFDAEAVSRDTVGFIDYARQLPVEPLAALREHAQHPLYPITVWLAHTALQPLSGVWPTAADPVLGWPTAAMAATLLAGVLVIIACYGCGRTLFDRRVGLWCAALAALGAEFAQLSADGLSDMLHLALYLFAVAAGTRGLRLGRPRWLATAGLLSGLAFLTRPEGAEVALVTAALAAIYPSGPTWKKRTAGALAVLAGFTIIASPYMLATGKLVQKKSVGRFLSVVEETPSADTDVSICSMPQAPPTEQCAALLPHHAMLGDSLPQALGPVFENYFRALRYTFFIPVVAWIILRKQYPANRRGLVLIAGLFLLHLLVCILLILRFDYAGLFSLRHILIPAALTLPFAAAGVTALIERAAADRRRNAMLLAVALLVGPTLPWLFETRHTDAIHIRRAGQYIRDNSDHRPRVFTERTRAAFYADGDILHNWNKGDAAGALNKARKRHADWLVFDVARAQRHNPDYFTELENAIRPGETLARIEIRDPHNRYTAYVYRFLTPQ